MGYYKCHTNKNSSTLIKNFSKKVVAILLISSLLTGCTQHFSCDSETTCAKFEKFLDEIFVEDMSEDSMNCHYLVCNPDRYGIKNECLCLGDMSRESRSKEKSKLKFRLNSLHEFNYNDLSLQEKLDYDILEKWLELSLSMLNYELYSEPLSPSNGLQAELPMLFSEYKFRSEEDVLDYLTLLKQFLPYFESVIEFEEDKAAAGLFMPNYICQKVIEQCDDYVNGSGADFLIDSFDNKLIDGIANGQLDINDEQMKKYIKQDHLIVDSFVVPAYSKLSNALLSLNNTDKTPTSTSHFATEETGGFNNYNSSDNISSNKLFSDDKSTLNRVGICRLPNGRDYYKVLVEYSTGCSDSIEEIDNRISSSRTEALNTCRDIITKNPKIINECSNVELASSGNEGEMLDTLKKSIDNYFPKLPDVECNIDYVDSILSDSIAPAFYITAPIDDYKNNTVYINSASDYDDIHFFTTLAHESIPGHLYQTAMSYDYGQKPYKSCLDFGGYVEGWATYVELMSYHFAGLDEGLATMLENNQIATLSLYASSDIGINYYGWNFDDLKDFWGEYGIVNEDTLKDIMTLIVADPGNYLKYYVGYLEFMDIKESTIKTMGENFNIKNFHEKILRIGPAPFDVVRKYI